MVYEHMKLFNKGGSFKESIPNLIQKQASKEKQERIAKLMTAIDNVFREHKATVAEAVGIFGSLTEAYKNHAANSTILIYNNDKSNPSNKEGE